jgi:hypothetical protein
MESFGQLMLSLLPQQLLRLPFRALQYVLSR